jgi:hypothetical protein
LKEVLWAQKEIVCEKKHVLQAEYYLLIDEIPVGAQICFEHYGVKLRTIGPKTLESVSVPHLSPNAQDIKGLMNLLSQNSVTPSTLQDVLSDWNT